jgi:hypothetical protein
MSGACPLGGGNYVPPPERVAYALSPPSPAAGEGEGKARKQGEAEASPKNGVGSEPDDAAEDGFPHVAFVARRLAGAGALDDFVVVVGVL